MARRQHGAADINPVEMLQSALDAFALSPGEVLFREGDEGDRMYRVWDGSGEVGVGDTIVEAATSGSVVGEMALIDKSPRSASVIARTACRLVAIDRKRFHLLVQRHPSFSTPVMKVLADRLRHMNRLFLSAKGLEPPPTKSGA